MGCLGWFVPPARLELAPHGLEGHCSIRLSYGGLAFQAGVEPATYGLGGRCSILLSYWNMVPSAGLEPATDRL